jgi:hypothetical protein
MSTPLSDSRADAARQVLEQDRAQLRREFLSQGQGAARGFPRSATFRWIIGHLSARSIASTALSAAMMRPALVQLAGRWLLSRRRSRAARR